MLAQSLFVERERFLGSCGSTMVARKEGATSYRYPKKLQHRQWESFVGRETRLDNYFAMLFIQWGKSNCEVLTRVSR